MRMILIALITVALTMPLFGTVVKDGDGYKVYDEQESSEITFKYEDVIIEEFNVGTDGWKPNDCGGGLSPFNIKVQVQGGAKSAAELKGKGIARWPEAVKLSFQGTPNGGTAMMNYGIEMEALYKICSPFGDGQEKPISEWLNFDLRFFDNKTYTPFLLDGNDENPVSLEDSIQSWRIWKGTLSDIIGPLNIPIIGNIAAMIELSFDLDGIMYIEMFGSRIALDEKQGRSIFADNQYIVIDPPLVGTQLEVSAHYESHVYYEADLILTVTIGIKIPFLKLELPIPIKIPIAKTQKDWIFNSQTVSFEFPAVFIEKRSHTFRNTLPGDEDFWEFDIENIGTRTLEGKLISDDPNFIIIPEDFLLKPNEKGSVTVFFKPYEKGDKKGVLKFYSNDPVEPFTTVALFGSSSESDTFYSKVKKGEEPKYTVKQSDSGCSMTLMDGE